jgi:hypothetical protein
MFDVHAADGGETLEVQGSGFRVQKFRVQRFKGSAPPLATKKPVKSKKKL